MTGVQMTVIAVYVCFGLLLPILVSFYFGRAFLRKKLGVHHPSIGTEITSAAFFVRFLLIAVFGFMFSGYASIAIGCTFDPGPDCEHVFEDKPMI